jgi:hypothetical protein
MVKERQDFSPKLADVEKAADKILQDSSVSLRLKEDDFEDVFDSEEIQRDRQTVANIKEGFRKQLEHFAPDEIKRAERGKMISEALEVVIHTQAESSNWFGENALTTRTTEYDDLVNGVDIVVEFDIGSELEPQIIALAIDASMLPKFSSVKKKIDNNIKKVVDNTKPMKVKYFESQIDGQKKKLNMIVPAVIGLEGNNANELILLLKQLLAIKETIKQGQESKSLTSRKGEVQKQLEKHPAQIIFLKELIVQLEMYLKLFGDKQDER